MEWCGFERNVVRSSWEWTFCSRCWSDPRHFSMDACIVATHSKTNRFLAHHVHVGRFNLHTGLSASKCHWWMIVCWWLVYCCLMGTVTAVGKTQKWPGIWQLLGKCWEMTKNSGNGRTGGILSAGAVYCFLKVCGYVSLVSCLCFVVVKGLCCLQSRLEHSVCSALLVVQSEVSVWNVCWHSMSTSDAESVESEFHSGRLYLFTWDEVMQFVHSCCRGWVVSRFVHQRITEPSLAKAVGLGRPWHATYWPL